MAVPTKFPAMLQAADGSVAQVNDLPSYNGASALGYVYLVAAATGTSVSSPTHIISAGTPVTPALTKGQPGGLTTTIKQTNQGGNQDDGR